MGTTLRLRMMSKAVITRAIVEGILAKANQSRQQKQDLSQLTPGTEVDLYRTPERKDYEGRRGPCELVHLSPEAAIVIWNGVPYTVPLRHIRRHVGVLLHQAMLFWIHHPLPMGQHHKSLTRL